MPLARWLQHREAQFWTLQLLGWAGFGVAFYIGALPVVQEDQLQGYYRHIFFMVSVGIVLTLGMRYVYRGLWDTSWVLRAVISALIVGLASVAWTAARSWFYFDVLYQDLAPPSLDWKNYLGGLPYALSVMLGWSGMYYGIRYYRILQNQTAQYLKASSTAHQAQLKMLRYQLNPHFLFNTLNAISTLVLERDTQRANSMVGKLSEFLRYSLDNDPMMKVTLKNELHALNLYLGIEKVRFQDRLRLQFDIEPDAQRALVPSLILQPLVENAVKYAIAPSEHGGKLRLEAMIDGQELLMVVSDDGPGMLEPVDFEGGRGNSGLGVGLRNTHERLLQIYGAAHRIELSEAKPSGLRVEIRLPYETPGMG